MNLRELAEESPLWPLWEAQISTAFRALAFKIPRTIKGLADWAMSGLRFVRITGGSEARPPR
jgi:hypothetical protein